MRLPERVALLDGSGIETSAEPLDALIGRSVREVLGVDASGCLFLDPVVANGGPNELKAACPIVTQWAKATAMASG